MRQILGLCLILEGFSSGIRLTQLVPMFVVYSSLAVTMILVRTTVGVVQFSCGWMLLQRRPPGVRLARWTLLGSAALTTLELGFRLTPTSLLPSYRWPAIGLYWLYALAGLGILRVLAKERHADTH